jgi:hypothetical protein
MLAGELRDGVGRKRGGIHLLMLRKGYGVAVDRRAAGEDHAANTTIARRLEDVQRAVHSHLVRRDRIFHRSRNRWQRSLVEDHIHPLHRLANDMIGTDIPFDLLDPVGDITNIIALAGREIIEHAHAIAALKERAHQIASDKSGTAGYETEHGI